MSKSVNKIVLIGNLAKDPESRYMPSGAAVCSIVIATSEEWKDKQTGEQKKETEYHRVSLFNRYAEIAAEYLIKGSKVYIEGKNKTRKYTDGQGIEKYVTEIHAHDLMLLSPRPEGQAAQGAQYQQPAPQQRSAPAQAARPTPAARSAPPPQQYSGGDFDDDIPFDRLRHELCY